MLRGLNLLAAIVLVAGAIFYIGNGAFIVAETQQAVVVQFGKPVHIITGTAVEEDSQGDFQRALEAYQAQEGDHLRVSAGPGLYFKIPFIQRVAMFEDRLLEYDSEPEDVVTKDKKHLLVDNFARWRIVDPLTFLQTLRTENSAQSRLDDIVYSVIREELAQSNLLEIVRTENRPLFTEKIERGREEILGSILKQCDASARNFGIQIVDVRIKRADLPPENRNAVFGRMRAERERVAKRYRSEGEEEAQKIRATTDRDVRIITAEAYRDAERIKGEGDGKAAGIYAEAYGQYPEFYAFTKSLDVIEQTIGQEDQLIVGLDEGVYSYLK